MPESSSARPSLLTRGSPCRLPVWQGQSIHMACKTYSNPPHSIDYTPIWGTEKHGPPRMERFRIIFAHIASTRHDIWRVPARAMLIFSLSLSRSRSNLNKRSLKRTAVRQLQQTRHIAPQVRKHQNDSEGIRTPAGRAQWISSPSP